MQLCENDGSGDRTGGVAAQAEHEALFCAGRKRGGARARGRGRGCAREGREGVSREREGVVGDRKGLRGTVKLNREGRGALCVNYHLVSVALS